MPDLDAPPEEIGDPQELLERLAFRNARMLDRTGHEEDPILFVHDLAVGNRMDIRRLAEVLGHDISDLIP
jgi:hypothetical protein